MKKILILTLGVGNLFGKDRESAGKTEAEKQQLIRDMVNSGQYPYEPTDYVVKIAGEQFEETVSTEYVATIQMKVFQPDMVIVIGTVKSGWSMFYHKFAKDSNQDKETMIDDVLKLYQIEEENGKDTDNRKLKKLEQEIQDIYADKLVLSDQKKVEIKVCLIRYGINSGELLENYQNISGIEQYLDKNEEYEVAFDITHSFRSLPVYNLVILNYLKQVSAYNLNIRHIYYGNFDVRRENDNKAPLVDLADISEILNLTNGVSEFKNTGNAGSLIQMLPESEGKLIRALVKFDLATQVNDRNYVFDAIRELSDVLNEPSGSRNMYTDAKTMLKTMLGQGENSLFGILDCDSRGEAQLLLAKWYQRQNRYGLAVATASEALRSLLVPYYLKGKHKSLAGCENENNRKDAIQKLDVIRKNREKWVRSEITDFLAELEILRKGEIKTIRDTFAHNLQSRSQVESSETKKTIDRFIVMLERLCRYFQEEEDEFEKVYFFSLSTEKTKQNSEKNSCVLISENYNAFDTSNCIKLMSTNGKEFLVYKLPKKIVGEPKTNDMILDRAGLICDYLERHFEKEKVWIVLDGNMTEKKKQNYAMLFFHEHFLHIYRMEGEQLKQAVKSLFEISYVARERDEKLMALEPEQVVIPDGERRE